MRDGYTITEVMVLIVILAIIFAMGGCVFFGVKGCYHVKEHGLKGTAEQIWYGNTNSIQD